MNKGPIMSLSLLLIIVLIFIACSRKVVPTAVITPGVPTEAQRDAPVKQPWEVKWEKLMTNARKEGNLVIYGGGVAPEAISSLTKALIDKFGIRAQFLTGRGAEVALKLLTERRSGLYLADVYVGGTTTVITQLKPEKTLARLDEVIMLPEVLDLRVWWGGKLHFIDDAHTLLAFTMYPSPSLAINPKLARPEELISYRNLLEPRWKGKISINDPTVAGTGGKWFAVVGVGVDGKPIMGLDFMRELVRQEPIIVRDQRLQMEWLVQGKYPIAIAPVSAAIAEFMAAGAQVQLLTPREGSYLTGGVGNVGLIDRPAHPNAATVFINWLLSKEGQTLFSRAGLVHSGRLDVPVEHLPSDKMRDPNVTYVWSETEQFLLQGPEQTKLAREIFGTLLR